MREILFKAQRIDNGEWVEGYYTKKVLNSTVEHFIVKETLSNTHTPSYFTDYQIISDTLCQDTGLVDKNGNKIWENDIVKRAVFTNKLEYEKYKITFVESLGLYGFIVEDKNQYYANQELFRINKDCELIGNIFDNADVLKGE